MRSFLIYCFYFLASAGVRGNDDNIDPASNQLPDFRERHEKNIGILTTSNGAPVDIRDTKSINADLIRNEYFIDTIMHSDNENVPERFVHAKGTGAFGYFEVTHDVSKYTKADVFNGIGKITPLVTRFSIAAQNRGGSDLERENRAIAVKFYTNEGNLDLLGIHVPVFTYKDSIDFVHLAHILKRNPATNLFDNNMRYDFLTLKPNAIHGFLWLLSDYGIPKGYRKMDNFPVQTFELYNKHGDVYYARFNFRTEQGFDNYTSAEAQMIKAVDADFFNRDLFNAIARKDYPAWKLEIDVLSKDDIKKIDYDPFDVTRLWRSGTYKTVPIGRMVLNKNPKNMHAEVEIAGFCPSHLVPGIRGGPDNLFAGRTLAYKDALRNRVGINFHKVDVNRPKYFKNYNRDGVPPVEDNGKDSPNYFPNSFKGPIAFVDESRPKQQLIYLQSDSVDLEPASYFYNHVLRNDAERQRLIDNAVQTLLTVTKDIRKRALNLYSLIDKDLGKRITEGLRAAKKAPPTPVQLLMQINSNPPSKHSNTPTSMYDEKN